MWFTSIQAGNTACNYKTHYHLVLLHKTYQIKGFVTSQYLIVMSQKCLWPATLKRLGRHALDHNFWTQNPSRSSKVSTDSDCSLVFSKNFGEVLPSNGLGPGPGEVGQGGLKALHLQRH